MPEVPNLRAFVLRNGSSIPFSSISYDWDVENIGPNWTITLPQPIALSPNDTWTIQRGFGGKLYTILNNQKASTLSEIDGVKVYTRTVSGRSDAISDLLEFALPYTIVFVNPIWLRKINPNAQLRNGIIKTVHDGSEERWHHPRMPGDSIKDDEFKCVISCSTHQDVAKYICTQIGYEFVCNLPDVMMLDTCTFNSGTLIFDALKKNFLFWQANFQVLQEGPTFCVLDILTEGGEVAPTQKVNLENKAIERTSLTDALEGQDKTIDHIIIKGRKSEYSEEEEEESKDVKIISNSPIPLSPNRWIKWQENAPSDASQESYVINEGDEQFTANAAGKVMIEQGYFVTPDLEWIILEDIRKYYDSSDTLVQKNKVKYEYDASYRQARTTETEEMLLKLPHQSSETLQEVKIVTRNHLTTSLNLFASQVTSTVEELVLYEPGSGSVMINPVVVTEALRADKNRSLRIEDDDDLTSDMKKTKYEWERYQQLDLKTLIQFRTSLDVLSGQFKTDAQILDNPTFGGQRPGEDEPDRRPEYRYEWKADEGQEFGTLGECFHPAITVQHDDISNDELAEKIRDRILAKRSSRRITVNVDIPFPIHFEDLDFYVNLPDLTYYVDGDVVEIDGGDYVLKGFRENINVNNRLIEDKQTLICRSQM